LVSGLVAWSPRSTNRVRVALIGGGGFAYRHAVRHIVAVHTGSLPQRGPAPDIRVSLDDWKPGLVGGADVPITVSPRVSILPTVRLHYIFDDDRDESGVVKRSVGALVARVGVGVGVGF
jgi:hypothetical protein